MTKLESLGYPPSFNRVADFLPLYQRVTDGGTNGQTDRIYHS